MIDHLTGEGSVAPNAKVAPRPRPGVMDIAPYVGGRASAPNVDRVIKLSSNESALGTSPMAIQAYAQASATLHRYPDGTAKDLRGVIASVHGLQAEQIVCGDGSDELLHLLALGFAGPGDEVLSTEFGFVVYSMVAKSVGATSVQAPETAFTVDVDALLERVTDKTRIVFVANPNSTGTYVPWAELTRLHDRLPGDVLLVIDSAYGEFVKIADYSAGEALVASSSNTIMTRTFSKAYGLAALRLGWCYGPPGVIDVLNRLRGPFNVTSPAQAAGVAALGDVEFLMSVQDHVASWRPWLERELARLELQLVPSVTNFVLVRFPGGAEQAESTNAHLARQGILVRDMDAYGLPDCLRITVGTEEEMRALIAAMKEHLGVAS
jgi:histidinol-phosphate aminotransferase